MNYFVTRPQLKFVGGGGGGGISYKVMHATLQNVSGFIGLRIPENIVLGVRLNGPIEWGLRPDRQTARQCTAVMVDKKSSKVVGHLFWRKHGVTNQYLHAIDLEPGEQADLMLLASTGLPPKKAFSFRPKDATNGEPIIPHEDAQFGASQRFYVRVDSNSRPIAKFNINLDRDFDGHLTYYVGYRRSGMGGGF